MSRIEVENRVSIKEWKSPPTGSVLGEWSLTGDTGYLILNVANIFTRYTETPINKLVEIYLIERICMERRRERIRIKGGCCTPCCTKRVAQTMMKHLRLLGMSPVED